MSREDALVERVTELEVRLSFQERTLSELDGVAREFAARVEALEREVIELRALLGTVAVPEEAEEPG